MTLSFPHGGGNQATLALLGVGAVQQQQLQSHTAQREKGDVERGRGGGARAGRDPPPESPSSEQ